METLPALLSFCEENLLVSGGYPHKGPVISIFDIFFDISMQMLSNKYSRHPDLNRHDTLWWHSNVKKMRRHFSCGICYPAMEENTEKLWGAGLASCWLWW